MPALDYNREVLQPLTTSWLGKVQECLRAKEKFNSVAAQCMTFFGGANAFWESDFLRKYIGDVASPRFRIVISKAFELVALYGPTLYWRNPTRLVKPRKKLELNPAVFGVLPQANQGFDDPTGWQMFEQFQQENAQRSATDEAVSQLLEMYLNYTPSEQPGGGLATHASDAITEALVKGRGCLWARPYYMPGSQRVLTGCFYDTVDNLLIDPDSHNLNDAKFIVQRCVQPIWEIERQFGLPDDSLKGKGSHQSADGAGRGQADAWAEVDRRTGKSFDLGTYYKIWSKGGCGGRLAGPSRMDDELSRAFDQVIGDYAYVVVMPGVPFPLNCPSEVIRSADDGEIKKRFNWPVPYWLDDRWPVSVLDFYRHPNSVWPIAPMAPGLGELAYLNILISQLANHVATSSRTLLAYPEDTDSNTEATIKSGADFATIKYRRHGQDEFSKIVGFIQHPPLNPDAWRIIDQVSRMFDQRVGLSELLYGMNPGGSQMRSAEESSIKKEMTSIRPDYMAGKVEDWMTEVADMEKLCARWFVEAADTAGMFGPAEQMLWDQLIVREDPEHVVRELRATVAANSTRKPDKARDTQNMQQLLNSPLVGVLDQYFQMTGDPAPINDLLKQWGKTIDQDFSGMLLQPPQQQGEDPAAQLAAQQQQMELEAHQQQLVQDAQQHQMKLGQGQQQMQMAAQQHQLAMQQGIQKMQLDTKKAQVAAQIAKQKAKQKPKARAA